MSGCAPTPSESIDVWRERICVVAQLVFQLLAGCGEQGTAAALTPDPRASKERPTDNPPRRFLRRGGFCEKEETAEKRLKFYKKRL